jgi:hypothetical protein
MSETSDFKVRVPEKNSRLPYAVLYKGKEIAPAHMLFGAEAVITTFIQSQVINSITFDALPDNVKSSFKLATGIDKPRF